MPVGIRHDPLRNYQFRLRLIEHNTNVSDVPNGEYIAGVNRVSGLTVSIAPIETWSGGNARHRYAQPDKCTWDPISLDQGLALDETLTRWAEAAVTYATTGRPVQGNSVKRDVILDVWDPYATGEPQAFGGRKVSDGTPPNSPMYRYRIHNAWVSRYQAMPPLDAMGNAVAIVSVELTHEGWRAMAVDELGLGATDLATGDVSNIA